ncbi:Sec-independent protein translocase protein TatB [uncultured Umboniibacter sp.]|uniref:Sec-independent protein translocase protein TatB n=1 Tax=uncultured Umboniibacter sp. TaxID=1798917 RepID=UPI002604EFD9|nr:Sec-independent protein translocase protein TatB [uncultured Umboniibacter sp.]
MDIGFLEFLLVMIVGLLVLGPERMPEVARKGIYWWGRAKRTINDTREEIEREIGADDIRRQLHNENIMKSLGESKAAIEATVKETTDNIQRFKTIGEKKPRHGSSAANEGSLETSGSTDSLETVNGSSNAVDGPSQLQSNESTERNEALAPSEAVSESVIAAKQRRADELAVIKAKKELAAIRQAEAELAEHMAVNASSAEKADAPAASDMSSDAETSSGSQHANGASSLSSESDQKDNP